jgi:hypothetical protein
MSFRGIYSTVMTARDLGDLPSKRCMDRFDPARGRWSGLFLTKSEN